MAPTILNDKKNDAEKQAFKTVEKKSDLVCRVKYCNTLPDIPFDLKFITYPFDKNRFIEYIPSSLERNYQYEVLTEHDLGVTIDLINRDLYQSGPHAQLHPADEKLLEEDVHTPQNSMRSKYHAKSVSWLRKSEYISTEQTRFQPQTMDKVEAKVGFNVKKSFVEETLYMDRDAQIKAIQKTFDETKGEINNHYSKPNVTAVEVLPLFPDFINWKYPSAQVIFDSDPAESGKNVPAQIEEMSQAMIRGVMDESGEQFVAYFLPTNDTLEKRRRDTTNGIIYEDDEEYKYKMAREYNWNVKSKASKGYEENYFLVVRPDGVYYNELETRVRLNKRRQKIGQLPTSTKLVVKHLPLNASEHRMQRYRERQLEPNGEEEEEMEESDADEEIAEAETQKEDDENYKSTEQDEENQSKSRSPSKSKSASKSKSRSKSGSSSRSVSRESESARSKRSASKSPFEASTPPNRKPNARSASRSHSKLQSQSPARQSKSRSASRASRSKSRSRSRSRSGSELSGSRSRSPSRSKSRSRSPSKSKSRSRRASRSMSQLTQKSKVSSHHSKSRSRSVSRSPSGSRSRSSSRSQNKSGNSSRSRSRTPSAARNRSQSQSNSPACNGSTSLRSSSGNRSGSGSGSE